ncbi:MAG: carbamoyltransferase C-terminal domain-containing protein [Candidatus Eisenbacteria bacterium]|nr:carbamoyltransferase C-terminal domain-containing protein [Candidatus Eisenbacteria bacterium]
MFTLGINAVFHDPAACLVEDGRVLAAAEEERFTRIKHGKRPVPFSTWELPFHAIDYCLREAGITLKDVGRVAYSFDPSLLLGEWSGQPSITLPLEPSAQPVPQEWLSGWDPLFLSHVVNAPRHLTGGWPHHLQDRFRGAERERLDWRFVEHHLAHAASAFHVSPFPRAAVLTMDGRGEKATTAYHVGDGVEIERIGQVEMPHSLGLLYEEVTQHLGFLRSSDEYKVMAMAAFGKPTFLAEMRAIVRPLGEGRYAIEPLRLEERFGPPRPRGARMEPRHYDLACSLQQVLEETVLEIVQWLHRATGEQNLVMAGGVALNCVLNSRIRDRGPFRNVWVQPAAGDAGTALGAAIWTDLQARPGASRSWTMEHAYLGPSFSEEEIEAFLRWSKIPYRRPDDLVAEAADRLAANEILGWFEGRMEFGPRALGARSILASPIDPGMQARLNELKDREDFRPVAPVVIEEAAGRWFRDAGTSPFMLFVHDVLPEMAEKIPAVRHLDGTARIQTIRRDQNPIYWDLIRAFEARTGVPILVNTSFNTRGEPIVATPRDAIEAFWSSPLDALVIGSFLVPKRPDSSEGPQAAEAGS